MIYIFVHALLFLFNSYLFVYYLFNIYFIIHLYLFTCFIYLLIYLFIWLLIYLATTRVAITAVLKRVAETLWNMLKMTVTCSAIFVVLCIIGWYRIDILHFKLKWFLKKWNDRVCSVFISLTIQAGPALWTP